MSWNPPSEWSEEDDHEHPGGQSSGEEDTGGDYHQQHRCPEQSSPSTHHLHQPQIQPQHQQHHPHPQHSHPQHQHHISPPPPLPPPPPPPPHQTNEHNPDHAMYADIYPFRIPSHQLGFQQPAPRQRTAIACRYCRRRKIRCSGFESSPDGRCANCLRFNQECVFTPVSSQAQAFVPAHAAYPHMKQHQGMTSRGAPSGARPALYGAHGQLLPPSYSSLAPPPPPPPPPPPTEFHPPQQYPRPSSPGVGSNRHPPPSAYSRPYEDQVVAMHEAERNRTQELHPARGAPPVPGNPGQSHSLARRGSASDYPSRYGRNDPPSPSSHLVPPHSAYSPPPATGPPPAFQGQNYGQGPPQSIQGNYYSQAQGSGSNSSQQPPRSPVGYHPPGDRSSGSPHPFHPPMQYPPPPVSTPSGPNPSNPSNHPILSMANLIDPNSGPQSQNQNRNNQRSATDGDMLDKLRPRSGF